MSHEEQLAIAKEITALFQDYESTNGPETDKNQPESPAQADKAAQEPQGPLA